MGKLSGLELQMHMRLLEFCHEQAEAAADFPSTQSVWAKEKARHKSILQRELGASK